MVCNFNYIYAVGTLVSAQRSLSSGCSNLLCWARERERDSTMMLGSNYYSLYFGGGYRPPTPCGSRFPGVNLDAACFAAAPCRASMDRVDQQNDTTSWPLCSWLVVAGHMVDTNGILASPVEILTVPASAPFMGWAFCLRLRTPYRS
jgi:hypothetical protein